MCLVGHAFTDGTQSITWSMRNYVTSSQFLWINIIFLSFDSLSCLFVFLMKLLASVMQCCVSCIIFCLTALIVACFLHICACFTCSSVHPSTLHPLLLYCLFLSSSCFCMWCCYCFLCWCCWTILDNCFSSIVPAKNSSSSASGLWGKANTAFFMAQAGYRSKLKWGTGWVIVFSCDGYG